MSESSLTTPGPQMQEVEHLDMADVLSKAGAFNEYLARRKGEIEPDGFDWYPYGTLANLHWLDRLTHGANRDLDHLIGGEPVVDIGTADGDMAFFMESLGYEGHAVDHAPTNFNGCRGIRTLKAALDSHVHFVERDLDQSFDLPARQYGLAFFLGILYHLKNPFLALESLARRSRHAFISTRVVRFNVAADVVTAASSVNNARMDISSIPAAYLVDALECNGDATNYWMFTCAGLKRVLNRAGWDVLEFMTIGNTEASDPATPEGDERAFVLVRSRYLDPGPLQTHARRIDHATGSDSATDCAESVGSNEGTAAQKTPGGVPRLDELVEFFRSCGHTDEKYLAVHYRRFRQTFEEFESTWPHGRGARLLDIGSHWLHQSSIWSAAGFEVTALDLPLVNKQPSVEEAARRLGIRLLSSDSLEHVRELALIPDDSFDVLLFTEVIEHLAFNPVELWNQVHRVMARGARLLLTTPNVYRLGGQAWRFRRHLAGRGIGIPVEDVVGLRTLSHHWKEYSRKELARYFAMLSPDFRISKTLLVPTFRSGYGGLRAGIERAIPFLRGNIHLELDLWTKERGIVALPSW